LLLQVLAAASTLSTTQPTYNGRLNQLHVRVPRIEAAIEVDGVLDEPVWRQAALLTGFSQFSPTDGLPAADSTEVLVWYSATAINFGIRAFEPHGPPHATLADRDHIASDDQIQIILSTFNDGRHATLFGVNPLGVQMDGTIVETGTRSNSGFVVSSSARDAPDLSPDYVFHSKGRITEYGYDVEISIPFKSLRYQPVKEQSWGINVVRVVQHSGQEDTWTPAKRAASSFLGQSGTLDGLTDLHRGLVLDLNPEITQRTTGAPPVSGSPAWQYSAAHPQVGGNARWGVTNNLTLNGTFNPDFSQVESDAGQLIIDPRSALFFPEKRPFFLDGSEQFTTPSQLIYTRRIVQPTAAVKLTGKISGMNIAVLSAADDQAYSTTGTTHPLYNLARLQRDLGDQSQLGVTYTDKIDGDNYNRVADVDGRWAFGELYNLSAQLAGSHTHRLLGTAGSTTTAPLWNAAFSRNGHHYGFRLSGSGIDDDFVAGSGFISRAGVASGVVDNRYTWYGERGSLVQSFTFDQMDNLRWQYRRLMHQGDAIDKMFHFNTGSVLRGGWGAGASAYWETFGYDPSLYANYYIERTVAGRTDTVKFTGVPRIQNRDYVLNASTPQWSGFSANLLFLFGQDENFFEWAQADIILETLGVTWRATEKLLVDGTYNLQKYVRRTDHSTVAVTKIPRVRTQYQFSRAIFVRVVGEYDANKQAALRDESRTSGPILFRNTDGTFTRSQASNRNSFRADWLFSYQPNPGTVFFFGYGGTMVEPEPLRFSDLRRTSDGFFVKLTYLFRM
jgi:hypothetical protein